MITGQIHRYLLRAEMIGLAQMNDLGNQIDLGGSWAVVGAAGAVFETVKTLFLVPILPP